MSQLSPLSVTQSRVLKYFFYVAIFASRLVGANNYTFDFKTKKFSKQTKFQQIYCALIHIIYIVILPWALASSHIREAAFKQQPFYILLNVAITVLRLPALFITLLGIWMGSSCMLSVLNRFEAMRKKFFCTLSETKRCEILKHNDFCILVKIFTSTSLLFTFYVRVFIFVENPSLGFIFTTVYFGILETLSIFKMNFFFCGMCYANCVVRSIREELWELRNNLTVTKVQQLSKIYMEMGKLVRDIRSIFQWEIVSIALASMVALIALVFSFIVRWQNVKKEDEGIWSILCVILVLNAALINILDFLMTAFICCNTIKCTRRIRDVLLVINLKTRLQNQQELQKELDFLALQFSVNLPYLNVCGLFKLTSGVTFALLKGSLSYLIVLVQFVYKSW